MHRPARTSLWLSALPLAAIMTLACGDQGGGPGGSAGAPPAVGGAGGGAGATSAGTGGSTSAGMGGSLGGAGGSGGTSGGAGGTSGTSGAGSAGSDGNGGAGGSSNAGAGSAGAPGGSGGTAGSAGGGGDSGAGNTAGSAGTQAAGGTGGSAGGGGGSALAFTSASALWTGVRFYSGSTPSNRTSGPMLGPTSTFRLQNGGSSPVAFALDVTGEDAEFFEITAPSAATGMLGPGANVDVTVRLVTDNARLPAAPMQDDGSTVLHASLVAGAGAGAVSFYALVLTYVELEPTFGQILDAFPEWTSNIPASIRNDANPGSLPGVQAGTDEVAAPTFTRANAGMPVELRPIARFSPPGLVPYGWHTPGNAAMRTTVGTMAEMDDAHTNDKSRLLAPPLASGGTTFEPSGAFSIFMEPSGVGTLSSDDAEGFDGAHRVKIWKLRDANDAVIPNAYLLGGEEAANGDYQDYVFVLTNVTPG